MLMANADGTGYLFEQNGTQVFQIDIYVGSDFMNKFVNTKRCKMVYISTIHEIRFYRLVLKIITELYFNGTLDITGHYFK